MIVVMISTKTWVSFSVSRCQHYLVNSCGVTLILLQQIAIPDAMLDIQYVYAVSQLLLFSRISIIQYSPWLFLIFFKKHKALNTYYI